MRRSRKAPTPSTPPLERGWVIVDGLPLYHRSSDAAGPDAPAVVHLHGFGISGTYMEPTASRLTDRYRTYVPDLPGHGRSMKPKRHLDLDSLAAAAIKYCDAVGVERATFVGNSLGCPVICAIASAYPDRIEGAVLVSPAGGPNNQPLPKALGQMVLDGPREPLSMLPIAVRDYLRFGLFSGFSLFRAMTRFPTIERVHALGCPTLLVAGQRDPLVRVERVTVFRGMPHVRAVIVPGAHALNYSSPAVISALIDAHIAGKPLHDDADLATTVELEIPA